MKAVVGNSYVRSIHNPIASIPLINDPKSDPYFQIEITS
jgi:hypothetical protein